MIYCWTLLVFLRIHLRDTGHRAEVQTCRALKATCISFAFKFFWSCSVAIPRRGATSFTPVNLLFKLVLERAEMILASLLAAIYISVYYFPSPQQKWTSHDVLLGLAGTNQLPFYLAAPSFTFQKKENNPLCGRHIVFTSRRSSVLPWLEPGLSSSDAIGYILCEPLWQNVNIWWAELAATIIRSDRRRFTSVTLMVTYIC